MRRYLLSPRRWARNWKLKLAALGFAILLWVVVRAEQRTEQWVPVRVDAQILDPDFELVGLPYPAHVEVRFAGRWRELGELALKRPAILLRVPEVGRHRVFILDHSMVRLPDQLRENVVPVDVRPARVRLNVRAVADSLGAPGGA
ncbi:MAG TPA: hypothetical protein VE913_12735 [Longimicrobium sp.]|nr:hypothetical protein [Longimicrobium sp.]